LLYKNLNKSGYFLNSSSNQFGFRKGLGCNHAIYTVRKIVDKFSGVASYRALGHVPPRVSTISLLVHFGVNLRASILLDSPSLVNSKKNINLYIIVTMCHYFKTCYG